MNEQDNINVTPEEAQAPDFTAAEPEAAAPAPEPQPAPAPAYTPADEPAPKKPFPVKLVAIAAAAVAVVVLAGVLISSLLSGKPSAQIIKAAKASYEAAQSGKAAAKAKALSENGSVGITADISKLGELIDAELPAKLNVTLFSKAKEQAFAMTVDAKLKDKSLADATLTLSKDEIVASSAALLGRTNYGVSLKNLSKNLPKSVLDPDQDTAFSLDEETYEMLLKQLKEGSAPTEALVKKAEAVFAEAYDTALKSLDKNGSFSKEKTELSVGDETVKAQAITLELDDKALAAIAVDMLNWAKSSKNLKALLKDAAAQYSDILEEADIDADEYIDDFYDEIDDMLDDKDDIEDALDGIKLTLVFSISKSNKQLLQLDATIKADGEKTSVSVCGGPDWKNPEAITLIFKDPYGSKTSCSFTVEENTNAKYAAKLKIKGAIEETVSFSWDKKEGNFKLSVPDTLTLTGTITEKGKTTTIELKKLEVGFVAIKNIGITVTLNESAKFPTISKYTDLLSLKEDDFEDLADDVIEAVGELYEKVLDELS